MNMARGLLLKVTRLLRLRLNTSKILGCGKPSHAQELSSITSMDHVAEPTNVQVLIQAVTLG